MKPVDVVAARTIIGWLFLHCCGEGVNALLPQQLEAVTQAQQKSSVDNFTWMDFLPCYGVHSDVHSLSLLSW